MPVQERRTLSQRRKECILLLRRTQPQQLAATNSNCTNEFPSFDDPSVISKIATFHEQLMSLTFHKCTVCLENFPSLTINSAGVCLRCHSDKHEPKLYSPQNNMDPGPVPLELTVSVTTYNVINNATINHCRHYHNHQ